MKIGDPVRVRDGGHVGEVVAIYPGDDNAIAVLFPNGLRMLFFEYELELVRL